MATQRAPSTARIAAQPTLVLFGSERSGRCRRVEGFVAQVLQRRHNHETFRLMRVDVADRPDLAERFRVDRVPTIVVIDGRRVRRRIVAPRGCREIEEGLRRWLL
jgi:thioredoxin-like negative regulator of GroEL